MSLSREEYESLSRIEDKRKSLLSILFSIRRGKRGEVFLHFYVLFKRKVCAGKHLFLNISLAGG